MSRDAAQLLLEHGRRIRVVAAGGEQEQARDDESRPPMRDHAEKIRADASRHNRSDLTIVWSGRAPARRRDPLNVK
jgi:hypothetical protein